MTVRDYMVIPAKLFAIGYLVGLSSCLTGLTASTDDDLASLMPRGFVRGILGDHGHQHPCSRWTV